MTTKPQSPRNAPASVATDRPRENTSKTIQEKSRVKGDVHVSTMGGDVRRVPGSGTDKGDKAIADVMREVLDRVRRSIRERSNRARH